MKKPGGWIRTSTLSVQAERSTIELLQEKLESSREGFLSGSTGAKLILSSPPIECLD